MQQPDDMAHLERTIVFDASEKRLAPLTGLDTANPSG